MLGLIHTADIFTSADNFVTPVKKNLACRFAHISLSTMREIIPIGELRSQQASQRRLLWDPSFSMPETATVGVRVLEKRTGRRWALKHGSTSMWFGPNGARTVYTGQIEALT